MQTMSDPEYVAEAKRVLGIVDPTSGPDMQKIVEDVYALPAAIIEKTRDAMKVPGGK
jgi:hypothetical protein